jgi:hypothetical protein
MIMAESNLQPSILFARDVVQGLRDIAHELSKQRGIKAFCCELAAELATAQQRFEELGDQRSSAIEEPRVLKLLDNLERLCQVSSICEERASCDRCSSIFSQVLTVCYTANPFSFLVIAER